MFLSLVNPFMIFVLNKIIIVRLGFKILYTVTITKMILRQVLEIN